MTEETKELIVAEELRPTALFVAGSKELSAILAGIKGKVSNIVPNLDTAAGRKEIASLAHKVARSKVVIDNLGKDYVSKLKEEAKVVDSERKRARDFLDDLKEEVRKPLTEWEQAEEKRVADILAKVEWLGSEAARLSDFNLTSQEIKAGLEGIKNFQCDESLEEFRGEAAIAKDKAINEVEQALAAAEKREAERAELEQLRKAEEERRLKEREEAIRREAEERAKREAEEKARQEREAAERRERELQEKAERAEREKKEAEERAERAAEDARIRAEAERLEKERREKEEAELREADKKHRNKIKKESCRFIKGIYGTTQEQAEGIFDAIAYGDVPHIKVIF